MAHRFYQAEESYKESFNQKQFVEKYAKDGRGEYCRASLSARLLLEAVELSQEEEKAILEEAGGYRLLVHDVEYGDHDDMGQFGVASSTEVLSLESVDAILVQKGHFYGVCIDQSALTIDGAVYGRCCYPKTPTRDDTARTTYYRNLEYELSPRG